MRIDAHQHFWRYEPVDYAWITADMGVLRRDFLPADLLTELAACGVGATIAVQARSTLEETEFLLELAAAHPEIVAVVGWIDLCSADVHADLERFTEHPELKGIRHVVQDEPDDGFLLRTDFQRGIAALSEFGLAYDILVYPRQLPATLDFVARFPDQVFLLDHLAKPEVRAGALDPWRAQVGELARYPNVACKISGLVTEAAWHAWSAADFEAYLDVVFEAFGPERVLYGSDWPVCLLAASSYAEVHGLLEGYAARLSERERELLFGANARRWYSL